MSKVSEEMNVNAVSDVNIVTDVNPAPAASIVVFSIPFNNTGSGA